MDQRVAPFPPPVKIRQPEILPVQVTPKKQPGPGGEFGFKAQPRFKIALDHAPCPFRARRFRDRGQILGHKTFDRRHPREDGDRRLILFPGAIATLGGLDRRAMGAGRDAEPAADRFRALGAQ